MLIVLGIILYLMASFIASYNMYYLHKSNLICFIICVFSLIPSLPAALTCNWKSNVTFWSMCCSILLYIIAIILFFI